MIRFSDAEIKLRHAVSRLSEAKRLFAQWEPSNANLLFARDPNLCIDAYFVVIVDLPPVEFNLAVGDFLASAQSALDFVSWEIFIAGGGTADHKRAGQVYFPILRGPDGWGRLLKDKLPTAWPEAGELLREEQDDRMEGADNTLQMLSALANSHKHRSLHLVSLAPQLEASFVVPELPEGHIIGMGWASDQPPLQAMAAHELVRYFVYAEELGPGSPAKREPGLAFPQPPEPRWELGLTDGQSTIALNHLDVMAWRVQRAIQNLKKLSAPAT